MAGIIATIVLQSRPQSEALNNYGNGIVTLTMACVPIAIGIAVLKHRLYDIDIIVNKTVVYAALAAFITVVYVAVVVGIGAAIGQRHNADPGLSILATAVVAIAFQPVRERVQRLANHLVYGKRATPYEALSTFSEQLAGTVASEDLLPGSRGCWRTGPGPRGRRSG